MTNPLCNTHTIAKKIQIFAYIVIQYLLYTVLLQASALGMVLAVCFILAGLLTGYFQVTILGLPVIVFCLLYIVCMMVFWTIVGWLFPPD